MSHIFLNLAGGCPEAMTFDRLEVYHAAKGHILRQTLKQRSPGLPACRIDGSWQDIPARRRRGRALRTLPVCQHDRLVPGRQLYSQFLGGVDTFPCNNPNARSFLYLRGSLGHDYTLVQGLVGNRVVNTQHFRFHEARVGQRHAPDGGSGKGVVRAVTVGEPPPAIQLPKGEVHPA